MLFDLCLALGVIALGAALAVVLVLATTWWLGLLLGSVVALIGIIMLLRVNRKRRTLLEIFENLF